MFVSDHNIIMIFIYTIGYDQKSHSYCQSQWTAAISEAKTFTKNEISKGGIMHFKLDNITFLIKACLIHRN